MMHGYKTWIAVAGTGLLGIYNIIDGKTEEGVQMIVAALALLGIGHKIEKIASK